MSRRVGIACVLLACLVAPFVAGAAETPANLCLTSETPLFSCVVESNGKLASVCRVKESKIIFYRFGKPGRIELAYPDISSYGTWHSEARKHFKYGSTSHGRGEDHQLSFVNGEIRYVISQHETPQGSNSAQIDVDATTPDRKTGKTKHLATVHCSSYAADWEHLKELVPPEAVAASEPPPQAGLTCQGEKAGDKQVQDARERIEQGRFYKYAVKTFGAPTACSVETTTFEGQVFPSFSYTFKGAEYEERADPPEASRSELKAGKGFPDEKVVRALLKDEVQEIGLQVDWSKGSDDSDTKTYDDPDANAQVELDYDKGKLTSVSISMSL